MCDDVRPLDCSQTFFRVLFRGITGSVERHLSNEIDQMIFSNELIIALCQQQNLFFLIYVKVLAILIVARSSSIAFL